MKSFRLSLNLLARVSVVIVGSTGVHNYVYSEKAIEIDQKKEESNAIALANKWSPAFNETKRKLLRTLNNGVQVYSSRISSKGILNVGVVEINASKDDIASYWENQLNRPTWDKSFCAKVDSIQLSPSIPCFRIYGPSKYIIPSRDFGFIQHIFPGAVLGIKDFNTVAYIQVDSTIVPFSWIYIRGKLNTILLLEPLSLNKTRVTYIVEVDPAGLTWLLPIIPSLIIGDNPLSTLSNLKIAMEPKIEDSNGTLTVEEAARKKFQDQQNLLHKENLTSIIDESVATYEELNETIEKLEIKLKQIQKDEKKLKLDLSELKIRIEHDLKTAKHRLRHMHERK